MSAQMEEGAEYPAKVVRYGLTQSRLKGTPCVGVEFEIIESGELDGTRVTYQGWLTPSACDFTFEALRRLGWTCNRVDVLTGISVGTRARIVPEQDEYQDKKRWRVRFINAYDGGAVKLSGESARAIGARFEDLASAYVAGKATGSSSDGDFGGAPDDDIPFASVAELCFAPHIPGEGAV